MGRNKDSSPNPGRTPVLLPQDCHAPAQRDHGTQLGGQRPLYLGGPGPPKSITSITVKRWRRRRRLEEDWWGHENHQGPHLPPTRRSHPDLILQAGLHPPDPTESYHQPTLQGLAEKLIRQADNPRQAFRLLPPTRFLLQSSTTRSTTASSAKTKLFERLSCLMGLLERQVRLNSKASRVKSPKPSLWYLPGGFQRVKRWDKLY